MNDRDHAVVVGITAYPSLTNLQGPENDAQAFAAWLTDPDGGHVPRNQVHLVCSSGFPNPTGDPLRAQPTVEDINRAFDSVVLAVQGDDPFLGRRLYVFMAGHGISPTVLETALLAANARRGSLARHIPGRAYVEWFQQAALFEEIVLIMDCCRDITAETSVHSVPWDRYLRAEGRRVRPVIGLATEWASKAREAPLGADAAVQGYFSTAILEGLRWALDGEDRITAASLRDYVYSRMPQLAVGSKVSDPSFELQQKNSNDPVLLLRERPAPTLPPVTVPVTIRFPGTAQVEADLLDEKFDPVSPPYVGPGGDWIVEVRPNLRYLLRIGDGLRMPLSELPSVQPPRSAPNHVLVTPPACALQILAPTLVEVSS